MSTRILVILFIITTFMITPAISVQKVDAQLLEVESYWTYNTGNETITDYRLITTPNNETINASVSQTPHPYVNDTGYSVDWLYHNDTGIFVGIELTHLNLTKGVNETHKFYYEPLEFSSSTFVIAYSQDSKQYNDGANTTVDIDANITGTIDELIEYELNNETLLVYPFDMYNLIQNRVGYQETEFENTTLRIEYYGNKSIGEFIDYKNGTVNSNMYHYDTETGTHISGYFAPSIYRITEMTYDYSYINSSNMLSTDSTTFDSKILLDYNIVTDDTTSTTSDTSSIITSTSTNQQTTLYLLPIITTFILLVRFVRYNKTKFY